MDSTKSIPFVHEWFHATAQACSHETAIDSAMGHMSYRDLDLNSDSLACYLLSAGIRRGDCVAIFTEDRIGLIVGCLGTLKAGGAFIPISADLPDKRIQQMLEAAPPVVILADRSLEDRLTKLLPTGVSPVTVYCDEGKFPLPPAQLQFPKSQGNDLSYIYFSSGSAGTPKAVAGKLESISHFIQWEIDALHLKKGIRVSQLISPSFDAFLRDIFVPLCCGGTVCIPFSSKLLSDHTALLQWIESQNIELVHCVPSLFRTLLDHIKPGDLTSLKYILLSGEALLPSDVRRWRAVMGDRVQLVNLYGPTETTMTKFAYFVTAADADRPAVPIGRPIQGAAAMVLDEALNPCPQGVIGEIYIRTRYRTLGYYRQPDLTKQVFIPNPFGTDPDDVIYKTGDYGRVREDGNFEFLGRRDRQVKIRGVRIELDEVEKAIRDVPNIAEAAVVDREVTEGNRLIYAYLVSRNGPLSHLEKDMIANSLPGYMLPDIYIELESLPRTQTGKVDYKNLPLPEARFKKKEYEKPQTPIQEIIGGIWKEVLGHSKIGINEDFFEVGGHSLLATRVITRLRRVFGIDMPLRHLFDSRTISGLASRVEELRLTTRRHPAPHIVPVHRGNTSPLSFAQERLCFIEQLRPGLTANQVFFNRRLKGKLDRGALRQSLNGVIRRHEILRTRLRLDVNGPVQEIVADQVIDLRIVDLTLVGARKHESWTRHLARQHDELAFNLATGPLIRATLLVLSENDHILLLKTHHIVSDGWSVDILAHELSALYSAACSGATALLPELPVQYADFALWQRNWLQGTVLEEHLAYWKKQLEGLPVLELPTDHARSFPSENRSGLVSFELSAALHDKVRSFCYREGATIFMVLMAIFQVMIGRHAKQNDVAVGTDSANRGFIETERLIGFFVNPLVIRVLLRPLANFRQLVSQVRECVLDAYSHENLPFEKLVEEISPDRNTGRHPLFQVVFAMKNATPASFSLPGLQAEPFEGGTAGINVDLSLMVGEKEGALEATFEYAQALFENNTIQRMAGHFRTLLEAAMTTPEHSIGSLSMLTEAEQGELVFGSNVGPTREIPNLTVWQLFERQAMMSPDRLAVVYEGRRHSYQELRSHANALATQLHQMGIGPGQCIGVCCQRSMNTLIAFLAILKCRASYLPLEPSLPDSRLAYMVSEAQPSIVIATQDFLHRDGLRGARTLCPERLEVCAEQRSDEVRENAEDNSANYLIYTSGSTGAPKGAMVEQHGMVNHLLAKIEELQIDDRSIVAQTASVSFDISIWQFVAPLLAGGTLHILSDEIARDGLRLLAEVDRTGVTILETVPSLLSVMIEEQETNAGKRLALSNLRVLLSTGEALPLDLCRRWKKLFPAVRLLNVYGPTECSDDVTHYEFVESANNQRSAYVPIGRPLRNTRLYVLDDWSQVSPAGVAGELYIGGAGVGRGYLNQPRLTAQVFLPDCFGPEAGGRLYRTGDLVRWLPGGVLDFIGRVDQQIKIHGQRLELGEIEAVLGSHPQVRETRVIVDQKNPAGPRLAVYVVLDHSGVTPRDLIQYLKLRLPKYMVPDTIMPLPCMPLNINGKLDYSALPAPELFREEDQHQYVAPLTALEEFLCGIWEELLKVPRIGVNDNIFDIGGHSLLAMQAVARIRSLLSVDLPLAYLFETPTVRELAQAINSLEIAPGHAERTAKVVMRLKNMSSTDKEMFLTKISVGSAATT